MRKCHQINQNSATIKDPQKQKKTKIGKYEFLNIVMCVHCRDNHVCTYIHLCACIYTHTCIHIRPYMYIRPTYTHNTLQKHNDGVGDAGNDNDDDNDFV